MIALFWFIQINIFSQFPNKIDIIQKLDSVPVFTQASLITYPHAELTIFFPILWNKSCSVFRFVCHKTIAHFNPTIPIPPLKTKRFKDAYSLFWELALGILLTLKLNPICQLLEFCGSLWHICGSIVCHAIEFQLVVHFNPTILIQFHQPPLKTKRFKDWRMQSNKADFF